MSSGEMSKSMSRATMEKVGGLGRVVAGAVFFISGEISTVFEDIAVRKLIRMVGGRALVVIRRPVLLKFTLRVWIPLCPWETRNEYRDFWVSKLGGRFFKAYLKSSGSESESDREDTDRAGGDWGIDIRDGILGICSPGFDDAEEVLEELELVAAVLLELLLERLPVRDRSPNAGPWQLDILSL